MRDLSKLPVFKYHPNLYKSGYVEYNKEICQCCGEAVEAYISSMYCRENIKCICLVCVASGKAAEKFEGEFVQDADEIVSDTEKTDELFKRTPGYCSWQGEYWLTCCDDYCAYIGEVGTKELEEMGIADEVFADYEQKDEYENVREYLTKGGSLCGYLFKCLHCGKYHLGVDAD